MLKCCLLNLLTFLSCRRSEIDGDLNRPLWLRRCPAASADSSFQRIPFSLRSSLISLHPFFLSDFLRDNGVIKELHLCPGGGPHQRGSEICWSYRGTNLILKSLFCICVKHFPGMCIVQCLFQKGDTTMVSRPFRPESLSLIRSNQDANMSRWISVAWKKRKYSCALTMEVTAVQRTNLPLGGDIYFLKFLLFFSHSVWGSVVHTEHISLCISVM